MIRSWSGGHIYGDIKRSSSFFEELEVSESLENSGNLVAGSGNPGSSLSDYSYDSDLCQSLNGNTSLSIPNDYDSNSEYIVETNELLIPPAKTPSQTKEFNIIHKAWIYQLQKSLKDRKQQSEDDNLKTLKRKKRNRAIIIDEARRKGKIGYDASTAAAKNGKFCNNHDEESAVEQKNAYNGEEEQERRAKRAHQCQKKLKEYITSLKEKREMVMVEEEYARERSEEIKRNITKAVLTKMRSRRPDTPQHTLSHEIEEKDQTSAQLEHKIDTNGTIDKERMKEIRKKYKEQLASTQRMRKEKSIEMEKQKRRLEKRALILKSKYHDSVPTLKIWDRKREDKPGIVESHKSVMDEKSHVDSLRCDDLQRNVLLPSEVAALTERLCKTNLSEGAPNKACNHYHEWKQQNGIEIHQKVFSMTGSYPAIRRELFNRGWVLNDDRESPFFDLKFALSSSDIDFTNLSKNQIVNHFRNSTCITTKAGLIHTLAKAPFFALHSNDHHEFFPRSYDLSTSTDLSAFIDDNMNLKAQGILNYLLNTYDPKSSTYVNFGVIEVLCRVIKRYNLRLDHSICSDKVFKGGQSNIFDNVTVYHAHEWIHRIVKENEISTDANTFLSLLESFLQTKKGEDGVKKWDKMRRKICSSLTTLELLNDRIISIIKHTFEEISYKNNHLQHTINGNGMSSLWIIKPAGKSRGRGIHVFSNLSNLLRHIKPSIDGAKPSQYVVQKYIENPLIIQGRKFDIRQWVLVTDWNPLTIWFYGDCYIRFAAEEYNGPSEDCGLQSDLVDQWTQNNFIHLVNNSIGKKSTNYNNSFVVEDTKSTVHGCMWALKQFQEWLAKKTGKNIWEESLESSIKNIAIDSILCAQEDIIAGRKGCFEVYGIDIMIDDNFRPWLIEINSSPACDYSTSVTESFIKRALPDILKVVLQDNDTPRTWNHRQTSNRDADTGGWEQIYCGLCVPKLPTAYSSDMTLTGTRLRKPKGAKTKQSTRYHNNMYAAGERKNPPEPLVFDDSDLSDDERSNHLPNSGETMVRARTGSNCRKEENKENHTNHNLSGDIINSKKTPCTKRKKQPVPQTYQIPLKTVSLEL